MGRVDAILQQLRVLEREWELKSHSNLISVEQQSSSDSNSHLTNNLTNLDSVNASPHISHLGNEFTRNRDIESEEAIFNSSDNQSEWNDELEYSSEELYLFEDENSSDYNFSESSDIYDDESDNETLMETDIEISDLEEDNMDTDIEINDLEEDTMDAEINDSEVTKLQNSDYFLDFKKIPNLTYKQKGDFKDVCTICLNEFEENEQIKQFECLHLFHSKCFSNWLKKNRTCPNCRSRVPEKYFSLKQNVINKISKL